MIVARETLATRLMLQLIAETPVEQEELRQIYQAMPVPQMVSFHDTRDSSGQRTVRLFIEWATL